MQSKAQRLISLSTAIVLAAVSALLMTPVALPMAAQNSVPPTAVEAARMPQFASKLAHGASRAPRPAEPRASYKKPADAFARANRSWLPGESVIYDNGPINGTTDAWAINFGFVVSDSFTVPSGRIIVSGLTFGAWVFPGDVLQTAEISITSSEFGGTTYFDGVLSFTTDGCSGNQYGYNVCAETSTSFNGPSLQSGVYWVNLQNAVTAQGNPIYWDENSGVGCLSQGCPSSASENSVGTIPSEAFTIMGGANCLSPAEEKPAKMAKVVTIPPSPTQSYRVIYNFTGAGDGGAPTAGLVVDAAGNLYGTTSTGGPFGQGTAFKLAPGASGWLFNRLYSFSGANGSGPDSTLVLDADGTLFGTTGGGGLGNGVLFGLSPAGHILPSVFSNWMETLLYSFTGGSDGAGPDGSLVLDSSGNIYGSAAAGGANRGGTLYEFTNGGIQVLHAFPGFPGDGANPIEVVKGSDGFYGITGSGGDNREGTLYTTAGGYQVLYNFGPSFDVLADNPTSLTADQAGNLYGTDSFLGCFNFGANVDQFSPPGWDRSILTSFGNEGPTSSWVSTDAGGNVFGTTDTAGQYSQGNAFKLTCCWNYTDLHDFSGGPSDGAMPVAAPVVDAQGNIYGTTQSGGAYGQGVVWEISP